MTRSLSAFLLALLCITITQATQAQGLLDGLRLTTTPTLSGARGLAMGGGLVSAANDWAALEYNPAALAIIEHNEISISLYNKSSNSTALFLGTSASNDITNTIPYGFAYAAPIPTERGHLAFALSLDRVADFTSSYTFSAVNPSSSFLNTKGFVDDPGYRGGPFADYLAGLDQSNMAWALYLTNPLDSVQPKLTTPYTGGMLQSGTVIQEGGINAFRIGAGVDVAENVSVGATINVLFGTYDYRRTLSETDVNGVYARSDSFPPYNLKSATITDIRSQSIAGVNLKLGLFAVPNEFLRFGLTFTTPTAYSIDDNFNRSAIATFTTGDVYNSNDAPSTNTSISNSYNVTSPLTVGVGGSFNHWGMTLSASASYLDYSQLHFNSTDVDLNDLNDAARQLLRGVLNWNVGGEYLIEPIGILVRGGYAVSPSPYAGDPSSYATRSWSAGVGVLLSQATILEFAYRNSSYTTDHSIYNDLTAGPNPTSVSAAVNQDDVIRSEFVAAFSFRF